MIKPTDARYPKNPPSTWYERMLWFQGLPIPEKTDKLIPTGTAHRDKLVAASINLRRDERTSE
jgi:hypothetical protein